MRRVVVEREHRLDFRRIVDQGKVFLAKLAQGAIGEENAALLGSLLVSAFHQAAMSRQDLPPGARRHFFLYLDEFHEVATPSMAALLTGARKYRLGLTLAHQELRQLEAKNRDLAAAVLANPAVRIVFRVGEDDAKSLERGFASFTAVDLLNLSVGEAIARVERADYDFNLRTVPLADLAPERAAARRAELLALTRATYPRRPEERGEEPPPTTPEPGSEALRPHPPQISPERPPSPAAPARHEPDASEPRLDKLTLDYLAAVAASPFLTVRERNRELGLSAWRGQRLKTAVIRQGLAEEVVINPGGRGERFKLLDLTPQGRSFLERYGVALPAGRGRGGLAHQWWAERIAAWLAARGVDSKIEDASSGARVDLSFSSGTERVAVEIEMGEGHAAENVRKDLAAGFDRVICLVDEAVNLDRLRSKLGALPPGVLLTDLRAFEAALAPLLPIPSSLRAPNQKEEPRRRRRGTSKTASPAPPVEGALSARSAPADPGALPTPEAAEYLGLSPATLETLRTRGGGPPFVKLGRRVVYRREDLDAWIAERLRRSTSDQGEA